nr:cytochrome c oxidase subunit III [Zorotypus medoensis]
MNNNHPYHLVDMSPWPILGSISALFMTLSMVMMFHKLNHLMMFMAMTFIILIMFLWWQDICRESTFQGLHTIKVTKNMQLGMILFITSEVLFFMSFFWAFFHSSLTASVEIGMLWPPKGISVFNPFQIPLLNTSILLASGLTITWTHNSILNNNFSNAKNSLMMTFMLGILFTILQALEYMEAPFTIADSTYGSTFFVATGFHGLHVIIGSTFLMICLNRLTNNHFSSSHHFGFEAAAWYWHFVDVVWIFLFSSMYWWGS